MQLIRSGSYQYGQYQPICYWYATSMVTTGQYTTGMRGTGPQKTGILITGQYNVYNYYQSLCN